MTDDIEYGTMISIFKLKTNIEDDGIAINYLSNFNWDPERASKEYFKDTDNAFKSKGSNISITSTDQNKNKFSKNNNQGKLSNNNYSDNILNFSYSNNSIGIDGNDLYNINYEYYSKQSNNSINDNSNKEDVFNKVLMEILPLPREKSMLTVSKKLFI